MKKKMIFLLIMIISSFIIMTGCSNGSADQLSEPKSGDTVAEIVVEGHGSIFVKFFEDEAPKAVENFVTHAENGYYDGLTFHRIIDNFMIQGGDPTGTGMGGESIWEEPFEDEFNENLQPYRGSLCMANSGPDSNGSQFFIVQNTDSYDEKFLDQTGFVYDIEFDDNAKKNYGEIGGTPWLYGMHTVFGQAYDGLDVLDQLASVEKIDPDTGIPAEEVVIETVRIFEYE